ncbi:MAG: (2Fe-2S)-binding protein [Rhodobacteraceae bacterium]|nr:(2Fe-2S)-binding protein [Paracoccaceae bacterium]
MTDAIQITVNQRPLACRAGMSVAAALLAQDIYQFRTSPARRAPRGAFCLMGACQECAIMIDGHIQRACQTVVRDGMCVVLAGASAG